VTNAGGIHLRFPVSHLTNFKVIDLCFCLNRFGSMVLVLRRKFDFPWYNAIVPFLPAWEPRPRRMNNNLSIDLVSSIFAGAMGPGIFIPDPLSS
jgi:hypothetical protein